jgi:hypothetical protein
VTPEKALRSKQRIGSVLAMRRGNVADAAPMSWCVRSGASASHPLSFLGDVIQRREDGDCEDCRMSVVADADR